MERCPNCGAPARPGAKFCTTCGYRLPVTIPVTDQPETTGQASSAAASSWPPPPPRSDEPLISNQSDSTETGVETSTETSFTIPVTSSDDVDSAEQLEDVTVTASETDTEIDKETIAESSSEQSTSTDSVVSSTWTATSTSSPPSAWGTASAGAVTSDGESSASESSAHANIEDTTIELIEATGTVPEAAAVTEETVVVDEPASQYEGWSAAVVEDIAPPAADHGTNVARATALLDELRLLLPVLNSASGTDAAGHVATQLEEALAGTREEGDDRQSLRTALTEARDNPRDIQTILGLAQQADAAIALLDDYDRLADAVRHAIHSLRPKPPGLYPSED